jgi:O-antigen ligase
VLAAAAIAVYGFSLLVQGYGEAARSFYFGLHYTESTRNNDAYFLLAPLFAGLGLAGSPGLRHWLRPIALASSLIMLVAVALSFSRGAWLATAAGLAFVLWRVSSQRRSIIAAAGAIALVVLVVLLGLMDLQVARMFGDRLASLASIDPSPTNSNLQRLQLLQAVSLLIAEHPLTGIGVGGILLGLPDGLGGIRPTWSRSGDGASGLATGAALASAPCMAATPRRRGRSPVGSGGRQPHDHTTFERNLLDNPHLPCRSC